MKKTILLLLIIVGTMYLAIFLTSCKSRKLSKSSEISEDKTKTEQVVKVTEQVQNQVTTKKNTTSEFRDQSGTWIWEEWYQKDKDADTLISPLVLHKRTTFIKNDITKSEAKAVESFTDHSEIKDSLSKVVVQKDVRDEVKNKDLEAKKDGSWIWALVGLILAIAVVLFVKRPR